MWFWKTSCMQDFKRVTNNQFYRYGAPAAAYGAPSYAAETGWSPWSSSSLSSSLTLSSSTLQWHSSRLKPGSYHMCNPIVVWPLTTVIMTGINFHQESHECQDDIHQIKISLWSPVRQICLNAQARRVILLWSVSNHQPNKPNIYIWSDFTQVHPWVHISIK